MGYMGFGMKKEVYTRKPKEIFKRLKGVYGEKSGSHKDPASDDVDVNVEIYPKKKFKHFSQTRSFKILCAIFCFGVVSYLVWAFYFQQLHFNYKQGLFEDRGILEYVNKNQNEIFLVKGFFQSRTSSLSGVDYGFFNNCILSINSPNLDHGLSYDSLNTIRSSNAYEDTNYLMKNDCFVKRAEGFIPKKYCSNWLLELDSKDVKLLDRTLWQYLNSNKNEIQSIISVVKRNRWRIKNKKDAFELTFKHTKFGGYTILFSKEKPVPSKYYFSDTYYTVVGTIREGEIFWTKHKEK